MPSIIKEENKRRDKSIKEDKDMKKNSKRRMFSALLILFLMIQMTVQADTGTKERVDLASKDTGSSVEELERQREEQQSQLDSLKEYQINLSDELTELNNGCRKSATNWRIPRMKLRRKMWRLKQQKAGLQS